MKSVLVLLASLLGVGIPAQISPTSPTTAWTVIPYRPGNVPDATADQQTGSSEGDIVGNLDNPPLFTAFYDGGTAGIAASQIGFRFRLADQKTPPGYSGCAFVGMDLNGDGALEMFAGVNNSGSSAICGFWLPGPGANSSPGTTSIAATPLFSYSESLANYSWIPVTSFISPTGTTTDVDGGGNSDFFLTFVLPFQDMVATARAAGVSDFNENSFLSYVAATATQPNSLNQDLNGVTGNNNSSATWSSLGGLSLPMRPAGTFVPEPGVFALGSAGLALVLAFGRRRQQ